MTQGTSDPTKQHSPTRRRRWIRFAPGSGAEAPGIAEDDIELEVDDGPEIEELRARSRNSPRDSPRPRLCG